MEEYIKLFQTHSQYETYKNSTDYITPNVSYCEQQDEVHYDPYIPPVVVLTKYNITDTSNATNIMGNTAASLFSEVEIDGVKQQNITTTYTFNTTGEHTIKYTFVSSDTIGDTAFRQCAQMTEVTIPNNVTTIGVSAFSVCTNLTSINIPDNVISIGRLAFASCSKLRNVIIGSGVTTIGDYAFTYCEALSTITVNTSVAPILEGSNVFMIIKYVGILYVPQNNTGYDTWMQNANYYLGKYGWEKRTIGN